MKSPWACGGPTKVELNCRQGNTKPKPLYIYIYKYIYLFFCYARSGDLGAIFHLDLPQRWMFQVSFWNNVVVSMIHSNQLLGTREW